MMDQVLNSLHHIELSDYSLEQFSNELSACKSLYYSLISMQVSTLLILMCEQMNQTMPHNDNRLQSSDSQIHEVSISIFRDL